MIDQARSAAADIDDRAGAGNAGERDQIERRFGTFLIPADILLALAGVDALPMGELNGITHDGPRGRGYPNSKVVTPNTRCNCIGGIGPVYMRAVSNTGFSPKSPASVMAS